MAPTLEDQVEAAAAEYLRAIDSGTPPDRAEFLNRYPDLATELGEFLDDLVRFKVIGSPLVNLVLHPPANPFAETATFDPAATPAPEHVLVPDYRLLNELARGGMGVVYRCHDPALDRDLAVKVLQAQFMSRPDIVRRFLEEARIAGQLQHPGIVPIHSVGRTEDGRPYFTMKLVRGRTLAELLHERPDSTHDLSRFLKIFEQIAQTIAFAHSCKVIHRDLKPGNVMVGAFGEVQVMDWGLAKQMRTSEPEKPGDLTKVEAEPSAATALMSSSLTGAGAVIGTPSYMSPEQARGESDLDERADVFGLGALLCEILTGHPPFEGSNRMAVVLQAQLGDMTSATERLAGCGIDEELRSIAGRCLSPTPENRPQSAEEVAETVTAYLASVQERLQAAELQRAAAQARALAAVRARRLGIALAVTVMSLLMLGVGGWFWIERDRALQVAAKAQALNDRTKRAEEELSRALRLREEARAAGGEDLGKWSEALAAAKRAEGFVASDEVHGDLGQRVAALVAELDAEKRDRELLDRLREACLLAADVEGDRFDGSASIPAYVSAFRAVGVEDGMSPEAIAALLSGRPVSDHLAAALFDWGRVQPDAKVRERLFTAADLTDPHPERVALRHAIAKRELPQLLQKATGLNVANTSPLSIRLLADALATERNAMPRASLKPPRWVKTADGRIEERKSPKAVDFYGPTLGMLNRAQIQYPQDFWLKHQLASWLMSSPTPNLDDAIRYYTAAVSIHSRSPGAYVNLGVALGRRARYDEAIAAVNEAIRLKPDYAMAHANLSGYLLALGRPNEALESARRAVGHNAAAAYTRIALGRVLTSIGRTNDAVPELRAATRLDLKSRLAWSSLAQALKNLDKIDEALQAIQEAQRIDDRYPDDQFLLGTLLRKKGRVEEALVMLQRAQVGRPNDQQIRAAVTEAWQERSRTTGSIPDLRETIRNNPKDGEALLKLANLEMNAGETKLALTHFGMAINLRPNDPAVFAAAGRANMRLGNHGAAERHLRTAFRLDPEDFEIALDLGRAHANAASLEEAATMLQVAIRLKPDNPWPYHHLSLLHERRGDYAAALEAHHQAAALEDNAFRYVPRHPQDVERLVQLSKLSSKIDGVLKGEMTLTPAEYMPFARLLSSQRKFVSSTRFFAQAFKADPKLVEDRAAGLRPMAAAAAFRAGLGQGEEAKNLPQAERDRHRKQAFDWLTGELLWLEKKLNSAEPKEFYAIQEYIRGWGGDIFGDQNFDFGSLPAGEREQWQRFWEKALELEAKAQK